MDNSFATNHSPSNNTTNPPTAVSAPWAIPPDQRQLFDAYLKQKSEFAAYLHEQKREVRIKAAGQDFFNRRSTLIVRRADPNKYAPVEDVLAYVDIYGMKVKLDPDAKKHTVTDSEIAAFVALEEEGILSKEITLEMVANKMELMKRAKESKSQSSNE